MKNLILFVKLLNFLSILDYNGLSLLHFMKQKLALKFRNIAECLFVYATPQIA